MRSSGKDGNLQQDARRAGWLEPKGRYSLPGNISSSKSRKKTSPALQCRTRSSLNYERGSHSVYAWTKESVVQSFGESIEGHKMLTKHSSEPTMPSAKSVVNSQPVDKQSATLTGVVRSMTEPKLRIGPPSGFFDQTLITQLLNIFKSTAQTEPSYRILVTVTLLSSLHSIRVIVGHEATVREVTEAALTAYVKEGRLSFQGSNPEAYALHFSQFCLQSLNPRDSIKLLGARNFVLCPNKNYNNQAYVKSDQTASAVDRIVKLWWSILRVLTTKKFV